MSACKKLIQISKKENQNHVLTLPKRDVCTYKQGTHLTPFFSNKIGCVSSNPEWIEDGYCDDETNNAGCHFDGGDCCGVNVNTQYCNECICY